MSDGITDMMREMEEKKLRVKLKEVLDDLKVATRRDDTIYIHSKTIVITKIIKLLKDDVLVEFVDWIHNNYYQPTGYDFEWRLNVEHVEFPDSIKVPEVNFFQPGELVEKYLNEEGLQI